MSRCSKFLISFALKKDIVIRLTFLLPLKLGSHYPLCFYWNKILYKYKRKKDIACSLYKPVTGAFDIRLLFSLLKGCLSKPPSLTLKLGHLFYRRNLAFFSSDTFLQSCLRLILAIFFDKQIKDKLTFTIHFWRANFSYYRQGKLFKNPWQCRKYMGKWELGLKTFCGCLWWTNLDLNFKPPTYRKWLFVFLANYCEQNITRRFQPQHKLQCYNHYYLSFFFLIYFTFNGNITLFTFVLLLCCHRCFKER